MDGYYPRVGSENFWPGIGNAVMARLESNLDFSSSELMAATADAKG